MVEGEELLFDPSHPVWRIIKIALIGLLILGGASNPQLLAGVI